MKRLIFNLLLIGLIVGASCIVLWLPAFMPFGGELKVTGYDLLKNLVNGMIDGTYKFGTTSTHFFTYSIAIFIIFNFATLLTMFILWGMAHFNLNNIKSFYRMTTWFLASAVILTGFWIWYYIDLHDGFKFDFGDFPWAGLIPLAASIVISIIGGVCSLFSRRSR